MESLGAPAWERAIARALQEYGAYLGDAGGAGLSFYAVRSASLEPGAYRGLLPRVTYPEITHIPFRRLRVLRAGRQHERSPKLVRTPCASFV